MDLTKVVSEAKGEVMPRGSAPHWTHHVAATTMVAGAILLVSGRPRRALAMAVSGATVLLLERPELAQEIWAKLPTYIKDGQELLGRAETFIERATEQITRIRETMGKVA